MIYFDRIEVVNFLIQSAGESPGVGGGQEGQGLSLGLGDRRGRAGDRRGRDWAGDRRGRAPGAVLGDRRGRSCPTGVP